MIVEPAHENVLRADVDQGRQGFALFHQADELRVAINVNALSSKKEKKDVKFLICLFFFLFFTPITTKALYKYI